MSVTAAAGFRAAGVTAGLKPSGRPDVALVVADGPEAHAAAVFTTNRVEAAPVTWSREVVADGRARVIVLNSGCANACTGPEGFADTRTTAEHAGSRLGVDPGDVVVCSTGMIGERLPMDTLLAGVDSAAAALTDDGGGDAAVAIMTTDTRPKEVAITGDGWTVGGMAKGAGMLAPALATMLVVLTTDAVTTPADLDAAVRAASAATFDRVDSDACMSTNDTVVLLASGASGVEVTVEELTARVHEVCADLARRLVADAEGARHDVEIEVVDAADETDAVEVARAVARSNLVKCAIFGGDPNWGRIVSAVGTTTARFDPRAIDVTINGVQVCRATGVGDDRSLVDLDDRHVHVVIDLHEGSGARGTVWTNDLTHDYVHENSAYST
ncbi:bifunctional glutamate N-acetyltransferase/amino-acid acetyltransferase ArgJ [Mobilicoccus massiliensis]|uniref:bifunctional glutamate N-acetyltransferase/amino-acid acetyltransferase ArgJ n=1 Tax=Mobilicoccus massiliensis TaxID=1522310 RepID=UPI00058ED5CB|nr:bifunctional glutamate N-acetyltransferase/amino-acid acetyltransferase ArgJ [Mobilicoccus massiliensis]